MYKVQLRLGVALNDRTGRRDGGLVLKTEPQALCARVARRLGAWRGAEGARGRAAGACTPASAPSVAEPGHTHDRPETQPVPIERPPGMSLRHACTPARQRRGRANAAGGAAAWRGAVRRGAARLPTLHVVYVTLVSGWKSLPADKNPALFVYTPGAPPLTYVCHVELVWHRKNLDVAFQRSLSSTRAFCEAAIEARTFARVSWSSRARASCSPAPHKGHSARNTKSHLRDWGHVYRCPLARDKGARQSGNPHCTVVCTGWGAGARGHRDATVTPP